MLPMQMGTTRDTRVSLRSLFCMRMWIALQCTRTGGAGANGGLKQRTTSCSECGRARARAGLHVVISRLCTQALRGNPACPCSARPGPPRCACKKRGMVQPVSCGCPPNLCSSPSESSWRQCSEGWTQVPPPLPSPGRTGPTLNLSPLIRPLHRCRGRATARLRLFERGLFEL